MVAQGGLAALWPSQVSVLCEEVRAAIETLLPGEGDAAAPA